MTGRMLDGKARALLDIVAMRWHGVEGHLGDERIEKSLHFKHCNLIVFSRGPLENAYVFHSGDTVPVAGLYGFQLRTNEHEKKSPACQLHRLLSLGLVEFIRLSRASLLPFSPNRKGCKP